MIKFETWKLKKGIQRASTFLFHEEIHTHMEHWRTFRRNGWKRTVLISYMTNEQREGIRKTLSPSPRTLRFHPSARLFFSAGLRKDYFTDFHKLGGRTGHGPRKSPWHFGVDPDKGAEHFFQQIIHGSCRIFGFHECVQFAADPNKKLDLVDFNLSFIRRLLVSYISQLNNGKESRKLFYYWLFYFSKHVYV